MKVDDDRFAFAGRTLSNALHSDYDLQGDTCASCLEDMLTEIPEDELKTFVEAGDMTSAYVRSHPRFRKPF